MYCQNCGKEVNDNAVVCIHCGCALNSNSAPISEGASSSISKTGFLLGLFLGLIGLIIGILMYKDDHSKQVFIKSWGKGIIIAIIVSVVLSVIGTCSSLLLYYLI